MQPLVTIVDCQSISLLLVLVWDSEKFDRDVSMMVGYVIDLQTSISLFVCSELFSIVIMTV